MKMLKKIDDYLKKTVTLMVYDDSRKKIAFVGLNAVLALVSLIMSVVNFFTAEYILMISTLVFSLGCGLNIVLYRAKVNVSVIYAIFAAEAMTLLAFFFVSGIHPEAAAKAEHILCSTDKEAAFKAVYVGAAPAVLRTCPEGRAKVEAHARIVGSAGITGTPTLIAGGKLISGFQQAEIEAFLSSAKAVHAPR